MCDKKCHRTQWKKGRFAMRKNGHPIVMFYDWPGKGALVSWLRHITHNQEVMALNPDSQFVKYWRRMITKSFVLASKSRTRQISYSRQKLSCDINVLIRHILNTEVKLWLESFNSWYFKDLSLVVTWKF